MKLISKYILIFHTLNCILYFSIYTKADFIIFSFNRPLQLYALLESTTKYISSINSIRVIYRSSDISFENAYDLVFSNFPEVKKYKQGNSDHFKQLTLEALQESPSKYILFGVDDIIIKDNINLDVCLNAMEKHGCYGFYLRLGKNLSFCYPSQTIQKIPLLREEEEGFFSWQFDLSEGDWAYPHTVDMTVYRKADIINDFKQLNYNAPNPLECAWYTKNFRIMKRRGLCFELSKVVNIPMNRVQNEFLSRFMKGYSPEYLLSIYNEGKKIDISGFFKIRNMSAHMERDPIFIKR